jgi:hypothetical protein
VGAAIAYCAVEQLVNMVGFWPLPTPFTPNWRRVHIEPTDVTDTTLPIFTEGMHCEGFIRTEAGGDVQFRGSHFPFTTIPFVGVIPFTDRQPLAVFAAYHFRFRMFWPYFRVEFLPSASGWLSLHAYVTEE